MRSQGANPYGKVLQSGYIILQGNLIPATVKIFHQNTVYNYPVVVLMFEVKIA